MIRGAHRIPRRVLSDGDETALFRLGWESAFKAALSNLRRGLVPGYPARSGVYGSSCGDSSSISSHSTSRISVLPSAVLTTFLDSGK